MPPAASSENQGLKIAVAVFVAFTVILGVTTYFGFSGKAEATAKLDDVEKKNQAAARELDTTRQQLGDLKSRAGYANIEEFQGVLDAITKNEDKLNEKLTELRTKVAATVKEYKDNGGSDKKVEDLHNTVEQIITQYGNEPSKTFQSKLDRMTELMSSLTQLTVAMSLDNESLRHGLNTSNEINQAKIDETDQARQKAEADLLDVTTKNEQGRTDLLARVDELQTANVAQANRIAGLENDLTRLRTQAETEKVDIIKQLKYYRELSEQTDTRLEKPNGKILAVDYRRNEVRVSLSRKDGAREQMVFSVFDRNSPGLPTEHPKAVIELVRVGDQDSLARIDQVRTKDLLQTTDSRTGMQPGPIRPGDLIYSPAFITRTFALIGKIDLNRDGRDDRDDLKRAIRLGGGKVVYDLPQPTVGKPSGSLSGAIDYYVIDERPPMKPVPGSSSAVAYDEKEFETQKADARQKLRDLGVMPMPLGRLESYFGITPGPRRPVSGEAEAIDLDTVEKLLHPKGKPVVVPPSEDDLPPDN
jgi:hypothetical protein